MKVQDSYMYQITNHTQKKYFYCANVKSYKETLGLMQTGDSYVTETKKPFTEKYPYIRIFKK